MVRSRGILLKTPIRPGIAVKINAPPCGGCFFCRGLSSPSGKSGCRFPMDCFTLFAMTRVKNALSSPPVEGCPQDGVSDSQRAECREQCFLFRHTGAGRYPLPPQGLIIPLPRPLCGHPFACEGDFYTATIKTKNCHCRAAFAITILNAPMVHFLFTWILWSSHRMTKAGYRFYFMNIVHFYIASIFFGVILGLDPRIQVIGVVRHRRTHFIVIPAQAGIGALKLLLFTVIQYSTKTA